MINIEVKNCNNIISANIQLLEDYLNIRYAMNGTGKSTIGKAIELISKKENLSILKPFDSDSEPTGLLPAAITKVLLFDEEFVNTIVFKESEVIQNAFEVFIKSPEYEARQKSINDRLKNIYIDVNQNSDLQKIISNGRSVLSKFTVTKAGELKQVGLLKSLTSSESIFKLPDKIKKFQPLMDKEYKVDWVGWKNEGSKYDDNDICPFCTSRLDTEYKSEQELFASSYTKSNVKNIKEMLSYFDELNEYMEDSKKALLYSCIQDPSDEQAVILWVKRFYIDLQYLVGKINDVLSFNSFRTSSDEISRLDEQLKKLKINVSDLQIFNNLKVKDLIDFINQRIDSILSEVDLLKRDFGDLKNLIGSAKKRAIADINEFLNTAGINYQFELIHESETVTKTILKYVSKIKGPIDVDNIKIHLSWGERNAFALVLFMHYALSQNPDLIILDDPISSFDSNKKYAIINRLFVSSSKSKKSFYNKTVLMLTHDFQPLIDFVINNKPTGNYVSAHFLQNKVGMISEQEITETDIKSLPRLLAENSKNEELNKIHRVASLRKLVEHMPMGTSQDLAYNLLSCLLHGTTIPGCKDGTPFSAEEIKTGEAFIQQYIADFEYSTYSSNIFTKDFLLKLFNEENNSYFRLQVFRVLITILRLKPRIQDDPLLKYIDEQFHIENDYIYYLDFMKYDIVPDFVIPKCIDFLKSENLIK